MLCKCHWIVLYTVHFTAFCLGAVFFRSWCSTMLNCVSFGPALVPEYWRIHFPLLLWNISMASSIWVQQCCFLAWPLKFVWHWLAYAKYTQAETLQSYSIIKSGKALNLRRICGNGFRRNFIPKVHLTAWLRNLLT